jgi:hypothetical protein
MFTRSTGRVTGVTINPYQVERGTYHTQNRFPCPTPPCAPHAPSLTHSNSLSPFRSDVKDQCQSVQGNFMELDKKFPANTFDCAYAIEATCHAPDLAACYKQVFNVIKPGAK